jgi:hypothetical protein
MTSYQRMPSDKTPYLSTVNEPRMMKGKGAPRSTVFGVLGRTKMDPYQKSLGGLVQDTRDRSKKVAQHVSAKSVAGETERHLPGPAPKTHVPGAHYGMVPYPGLYRSHEGARL